MNLPYENNLFSAKRTTGVSRVVKEDPVAAALLSKLVATNRQTTTSMMSGNHAASQHKMKEISKKSMREQEDNLAILDLFPEIGLSKEILVSSVMSPKDMVNEELNYSASHDIVRAELNLKLVSHIKSEMEKVYKLHGTIPDILTEAMVTVGACAYAVLPESSVDDLINNSKARFNTESLSDLFETSGEIKGMGFLGEPTTARECLSMESIQSDINELNSAAGSRRKVNPKPDKLVLEHLEITDNFSVLKLPRIAEALSKAKTKSLLRKRNNIGFESSDKPELSRTQIAGLVMKKQVDNNYVPFMKVPTKEMARRKSLGRPLILKLPIESVINVVVPGDPTNRLGAFVLLDSEGNPLSRMSKDEVENSIGFGLQNTTSQLNSYLLQKARQNLINDSVKELTIDNATSVYAEILEAEVLDRLRNGVHGRTLELIKDRNLDRIMLSRALANKRTRLLYLPEELLSYFVLRYKENGTGKSILDDLKIIAGLSAQLLLSRVYSQSRNAIPITSVTMNLNPNDPDPEKTIEEATDIISQTRQAQFMPVGLNKLQDLVEWLHKAGFEWQFKGHPKIPETMLEFETKNMTHSVPDSDLEESLRKQRIMAFWLSPEHVDNSLSPDFATTVTNNSIMLSKRIKKIQDTIGPQLTAHVVRIVRNDEILREQLIEILTSSKGLLEPNLDQSEKEILNSDPSLFFDDLLDDFLDSLKIEFPKPDTTSLTNLTEAYDAYSDAVDKSLKDWISSELLTSDVLGDVSGYTDAMVASYKAYFMRDWQAKHGYLPELADITAVDDKGAPLIDLSNVSEEHVKSISRGIIRYLDKVKTLRAASNKDIENINNGEEAPEAPESTTDSDSGDETDSGSGDDNMDGDPFAI